MPDYRLRRATLEDLDALVRHRVAMFTDMGVDVDTVALRDAYAAWLRAAMPVDDYRGWVVETSGSIVAGAGIAVFRWPPGPRPVSGDELAFVYNVYTEPEHRKRGLARSLMQAIHAWCAAHGIHALALNAAADARPLYDSLGYFDAPSPMMYKIL